MTPGGATSLWDRSWDDAAAVAKPSSNADANTAPARLSRDFMDPPLDVEGDLTSIQSAEVGFSGPHRSVGHGPGPLPDLSSPRGISPAAGMARWLPDWFVSG